MNISEVKSLFPTNFTERADKHLRDVLSAFVMMFSDIRKKMAKENASDSIKDLISISHDLGEVYPQFMRLVQRTLILRLTILMINSMDISELSASTFRVLDLRYEQRMFAMRHNLHQDPFNTSTSPIAHHTSNHWRFNIPLIRVGDSERYLVC